jgi:hypothetical protein
MKADCNQQKEPVNAVYAVLLSQQLRLTLYKQSKQPANIG